MREVHRKIPGALVALAILAVPQEAAAYVGPGAGLTVIGAAIAFVGGLVLAVLGFIWYPIKRLLRGRAKRRAESTDVPKPAN